MEVYDRIIRNEKQHALEIQELKQNDADKTEEIKKQHALEIQELKQNDADKTEEINFLKQQIEEIQVSNPPETCAHLGKQGVTRTQDIFIDSDGVNQGTIFSHLVSAETILFLFFKSKGHT